jgi:hypothetical protein
MADWASSPMVCRADRGSARSVMRVQIGARAAVVHSPPHRHQKAE